MTDPAVLARIPPESRETTAVRDWSTDAWRSAYEELGERVFRLLHRITGDEALAQDLTHDTFVTVAEKASQYAGRGTFAAWVFRIAVNTARGRLRRDRDRRRLTPRIVEHTRQQMVRGDPEMRIVVEAALRDLADGQRSVLLLHDVDGYTHPEIAEMLNIAVGSSKARLSRARARMRDLLADAL